MRVLYIPFYTNKDFLHCTTYVPAVQFFKKWLSMRDDLFVYWPIPYEDLRFGHDFSEIDHDRILKVECDIETQLNQVKNMCHYSRDIVKLFNDYYGKYQVDMVINDWSASAAYLRGNLYSHFRPTSIRPFWVNFNPFVLHYGVYSDDILNEQLVSYLSADMLVWQSKSSFKRVLKSVRKIFKASVIEDIIKKSSDVYNTYLNVDSIMSVERIPKPKDRWVVNYGNAINSYYKTERVFKIFDYLFSSGHDVKVIANSPGTISARHEFSEAINKRYSKYFEFTSGLNQLEYWHVASGAHASIFAGVNVESSFTTLEQALLDIVVVFFDSEWARESTYEGYPYIARSDVEACTMLKYILEHYFDDDVQDVVNRQREYVLEHYSNKNILTNLILSIEDRYKSYYKDIGTVGKSLVEALVPIMEDIDELSWEDYGVIVKHHTMADRDISKDFGSRDSGFLKSVFRYILLYSLGFRDTCDGPNAYFVKAER